MSKIIAIVLAILVIGGGIVAFTLYSAEDDDTSPPAATTADPASSAVSPTPSVSTGPNGEEMYVIEYGPDGFAPSTSRVKAGSYITIKNGEKVELASDPHPRHTSNSELNLKAIEANESITFKVTKKGTFGYHNHLNPAHTGTLIVE